MFSHHHSPITPCHPTMLPREIDEKGGMLRATRFGISSLTGDPQKRRELLLNLLLGVGLPIIIMMLCTCHTAIPLARLAEPG